MNISNSLNRIEEILDLLDSDFFDDGEREELGIEADAISKEISITIDYDSLDWKVVG